MGALRYLVLFAWDALDLAFDLIQCRVAGHDWQWSVTSTGREVRCALCGHAYRGPA